MNDNKQLQALLTIIMAVATAFLGITTYRDGLSSYRPPVAVQTLSTGRGEEDVIARLWEDPVTAVRAAVREHQDVLLGHDAEALWKSFPDDTAPEVLAVMVEGTPFAEDIETRLRLRYALQAALLQSGFAPRDRTTIGFVTLDWPRTPELHAPVPSPPSLVPVAARLADGQCGGDIPALLASAEALGLSAGRPHAGAHVFVPYEMWHSAGEPVRHLLVLWLSEEELADDPLWRLRDLLSRVFRDFGSWPRKVTLIGPRSSDTLARMARPSEEDERADPLPIALRILSPSASAPDADVLRHIRCHTVEECVTSRVARLFGGVDRLECTGAESPHPRVWESLTVGDEVMGEALVGELKRRGIEVAEKAGHHVVLISEADTIYGRALPGAFTKAVAHDPLHNVHQYAYLRGLDGRTARAAARADEKEQRPASAEDALRRAVRPVGVTAEGEAQFDYLERLAADLERREKEWDGIRAIGILGSDPYDKLVILEALRPRFPEAVFFTTDLDARLWDAPARRLTHNMIVASPYDPQRLRDHRPTPRAKFDFPELRDSGQQGLYQAALLAISAADPPETAKPVLFEIGRTRPIRLTLDGGGETRSELWSLPTRRQKLACLMLLLGAGGLWLSWRRREHTPLWPFGSPASTPTPPADTLLQATLRLVRFKLVYLPCAGFIVALFAAWCFHLSGQSGGEPMELAEGVSVWPTEIMRVAIVLLSAGLIRWAWLAHVVYRTRAWREWFALPTDPDQPDLSTAPPDTATSPDTVDARATFLQYAHDGRWTARGKRVAAGTALYFVFGMGMFALLGFPVPPTRDGTPMPTCIRWLLGTSAGLDRLCLFAAILAFISLTFYVVDSALLTRRLLKRLADKPTVWPSRVVWREAQALGLDPASQRPFARTLEGLIDVRYAAAHTREFGSRLYLPFVVMLAMIVSRSGFFDNWTWPPPLILINVCSLAIVVVTGLLSRRAARAVREAALAAVSREIGAAEGLPNDASRPVLAELEGVKRAIADENGGAFAWLVYDPSVLALLIPTGGYGVFLLIGKYVLGL